MTKTAGGSVFRVAEFFAGIGLMRMGLEAAGNLSVVWANDIEPDKARLYRQHFTDESDHFDLRDVRTVRGDDVPDVELATASFPCTDLSLAGDRAGLDGSESGMFWEFARIIEEMGYRKPVLVLLENVPGFATSNGGRDLLAAVRGLNDLGYVCDMFVLDASRFVPQSRLRMFVVGVAASDAGSSESWEDSTLRPSWVQAFVRAHPTLSLRPQPLPEPPPEAHVRLVTAIERLPADSPRWWSAERLDAFVSSLSDLQSQRLAAMMAKRRKTWRTAYRRTRSGRAVWEIRADEIAGCLRTARGGSSKQAVVEAGGGSVRVRWMTPREYAALQGAPNYVLGDARDNQAYFGFGDAVCVPVITWIADNYLLPLLAEQFDKGAVAVA